MRPFRLVCTVLFFFVIAFFILLSLSQPIPTNSDGSRQSRSDFRSRWSFGAPASLFPPSAIISLTDDNTTFFLARPALYGPLLPADGLTGQLWVGSGFGDDTLIRGGMLAVGQAELGCSDIPGWSDERAQYLAPTLDSSKKTGSKLSNNKEYTGEGPQSNLPEEDDDTDNFLHYPLRGGPLLKSSRQVFGQDVAGHADIQSLQESAEISGKVVLLSRGGCGFSEKTKWVQRRGGVALIVGDYTRGGHLIQMSSNDDTSNITIPSIFTAYTSAHLLSSLVPSKSNTEALDLDKVKKQQKNAAVKPAVTTNPSSPKATKIPAAHAKSKASARLPVIKEENKKDEGWFNSIYRKLGLARRYSELKDSRRPPGSGTISWVQSQDWDDDKSGAVKAGKFDKTKSKTTGSNVNDAKVDDDFVIGVHDWRDPDMIPQTKNEKDNVKASSKASPQSGGTRAPESGVYGSLKKDSNSKQTESSTKDSIESVANDGEESWLHNILGSGKDESTQDNQKAQDVYKKTIAPHFVQDQEFEDDYRKKPVEREGLWITMTPTSVSTSPLFDTLLVLVVSPLVTLSVVYALLLLRSRIRRRRWRAPRSVVDRLPVRTYQTMSCSSSTSGSQIGTPHTSNAATPLLPPSVPRSRPRSATLSSIRQEASASLERATAHLSSREKSSHGNTFKRKYKSRQVECVVCLEEYVDGQSQVMSLPCGHEFHAECITPWLTTRRRTCPICKGDVVRSMDNSSTPASSSASSSYTSLVLLGSSEQTAPRSPTQDNSATPNNSSPTINPNNQSQRPSPVTHASDASLQATIAQTRNDNPSSAIPIPSGSSIRAGSNGRGSTEDLAATLVGSRQTGDGIFTPPSTSRRTRDGR